ncbi:MAG TPA: epimerase [Chloroflexota bacterium]|jgi:2'-hydroxyisoflavone reductase|nr:epimerase [Chloroflexota bacterium]
MRILIIGGTVFLGRHITEAALDGGHHVTLFHRGQHGPDLFPNVERILGDRTADLDRLRGSWDAVIDVCGYFPRDVKASAQALADKVDRYVFISTISVFADLYKQQNIDENGTLAVTEDTEATEVTGENYGPLKALCEQAAEGVLPGRTFIIRPGLIVGPHDPTDRFTYWPVRALRGGDILAPAPAGDPVQIVDVRDLAGWTVRAAVEGAMGLYNATGPDYALSIGGVLDACREAAGTPSTVVWADPAWLVEQGVKPWLELPVWIPDAPGFARVDCSKAIAAGLTFRPLADTVRNTVAWAETRTDHEWRAGITPEREAELLEAWADRKAD